MGDFNPVLSNGTCWSNVNVRSVDDFIPCGNDAGRGQHFACCNHGDTCLSSNACYSSKYGSTYVAGCTDQGFGSAACPDKGSFYDQQWVGLVRCMVSDDNTKNDEEWAGCKESDGKGGLGVPDKCDCNGKIPLFKDGPTLTNIAHLPLGSGETISFFPGFEPASATDAPTQDSTDSSTTTAATATGQSSATEAATGPKGLPTSESTPTSSAAAAGLSTAAQAGIGVGAGAGGLIIAFLIIMAIMLRRQKKKNKDEGATLPTTQVPPPLPRDGSDHADPSLSGFKSELAADEPKNFDTSAATSPNSPVSVQSQQQQQRYQAYNPDIHGNYSNNTRYSSISDMSSTRDGGGHGLVTPISAQSTGMQAGGDARNGQPAMGPIHELQG
ncbi:hypothetical protein F4809DRAFT_636591 [Biscogniauxia mediterranea]|nr:hypothetical protein F4809DRAFT_636591 [Biscogniauxia mediterranea]